jgi:hypothetical protein
VAANIKRSSNSEDLTGDALAREVVDKCKLIPDSVSSIIANVDVTYLMELNQRFAFPSEHGEVITPCLLVPSLFDAVWATVPKTANGRLLINGPVTLESVAEAITELARRVAYLDKEDKEVTLDVATALTNLAAGGLTSGLIDAMTTMTADDFVRYWMLKEAIVPEGLNSVRVGPSRVHGNGVFARRNIKKGDLITMYPTEIITSKPRSDLEKRWYRSGGKNLTLTECEMATLYLATVENTPFQIASIDPDVYSPACCGHLINDGSCLDKPDFTRADANEYIMHSCEKQNCTFVPIAGCAVAVVATRDIHKRNEVYTAYGISFWAQFTTPRT